MKPHLEWSPLFESEYSETKKLEWHWVDFKNIVIVYKFRDVRIDIWWFGILKAKSNAKGEYPTLYEYEGWKWIDCIHTRQKVLVVFTRSISGTCVQGLWVSSYQHIFFFLVNSAIYIPHGVFRTHQLLYHPFLLQLLHQNVKIKRKRLWVLFLKMGRGRDQFEILIWGTHGILFIGSVHVISTWKCFIRIWTK